ncbi:ISL3 family transposase [Streptomyces flaveus]|uniref:ISL3 family transposase n=1 Tax=Streptomyces flaveus TaxID=66370 RepID=UPI00332520B9
MQADSSLWDSFVFGGIDELDVTVVTVAFGTVDVTAKGRGAGAACPDCGRFSGRVHDSYQRRLKDLPLGGQSVVIRLTVRRFICGAGDCPRRTFAEPFARLTTPHARFTTRLNHVLERVGLALAGRAGARLVSQLGINTGRMTLLRRVMAPPDPQFSTPRVLGVDDFAIRRGQTYSTVLTCQETHRVVDVLPTREAGPLAAWLATHPGVEIICRDRAGAYAEGARLGAPDALQVADRFHLWQGLGRAVETCVAAHRQCLRAPAPPQPTSTDPPPGTPGPPVPDPAGRRAQRKKAAHALVHELLAQGHSRRAIARHLGWGLNTVLRYARATHWQDTLRENRPRPSRLDPYKP